MVLKNCFHEFFHAKEWFPFVCLDLHFLTKESNLYYNCHLGYAKRKITLTSYFNSYIYQNYIKISCICGKLYWHLIKLDQYNNAVFLYIRNCDARRYVVQNVNNSYLHFSCYCHVTEIIRSRTVALIVLEKYGKGKKFTTLYKHLEKHYICYYTLTYS